MTAVSPLAPPLLFDSTDSLLRFVMRADATLTGVAGLAVAVAADPISSLTGLTSLQEYGLGAFFVLLGLAVFTVAALQDLRRAGVGVIVANLACTVAAVVTVAVGALPLTAVGVTTTLAGGACSSVLAYLQYLGVRRLPV
jgi:hypothetical protein